MYFPDGILDSRFGPSMLSSAVLESLHHKVQAQHLVNTIADALWTARLLNDGVRYIYIAKY